MDIYKARNLQKECFKNSNVNFKKMGTKIFDNILYYSVLHLICRGLAVQLDEDTIDRIKNNFKDGIITNIQYINMKLLYPDSGILNNIPDGLYSVELIPVD